MSALHRKNNEQHVGFENGPRVRKRIRKEEVQQGPQLDSQVSGPQQTESNHTSTESKPPHFRTHKLIKPN